MARQGFGREIGFGFDRGNLGHSAAVPLLVAELRADVSARNFDCELGSGDSLAETEHVAVVVFHALVSGIGVAGEERARTRLLYRGGQRPWWPRARRRPAPARPPGPGAPRGTRTRSCTSRQQAPTRTRDISR